MISTKMHRGVRFYHRIDRGGGYGCALIRNQAMVDSDVKNGKVTCCGDREDCRVVLNHITFEIDKAATSKLRRQMRTKSF